MTDLQKRMIESLQLRGMSERTQEAYVRAVRQLAQHYHKSPDLVTEEELRQYFLYIKNVKNYARATTTIALCGIKFFVEWTLGRKWTLFDLVRPPRENKLPTILSVEEARKIFRLHGARYRAKYGHRMPHSHLRAISWKANNPPRLAARQVKKKVPFVPPAERC
jgi:site-specific recombinase XerD